MKGKFLCGLIGIGIGWTSCVCIITCKTMLASDSWFDAFVGTLNEVRKNSEEFR